MCPPETFEVSPDQGVQSFKGIEAAILSGEEFKAYQVETPEEGYVVLTYNEVSLFIVDFEVWRDQGPDRLLVEDTQDRVGLVLVGSQDQLEMRSLDFHSGRTSLLCYPIARSQLKHQLANLMNLQASLYLNKKTHKEEQKANESVKNVLRVSRELNGIRDTNKLLSLILLKAREVTNADAGSLYVVEWREGAKNEGSINFKVTQNESVKVSLAEFQIPISPGSIVGNAVILGKTINIPDLYNLDQDPEKNPYGARHDKKWDRRLGYESRSMLTVPMFDISYRVIGVIQLINRKKSGIDRLDLQKPFLEQVTSFDEQTVEYAEIVAQQAGIALENALLTEEKEQLFEGFVHASVTAIEQRDPTTSGHSHRVAQLTVGTAEIINGLTTGPFGDVFFNENQLKELDFASLLHDFGKLGVREQVLVKAKKLYGWELDLLLARFELIKSQYEIESLEDVIKYYESPLSNYPPDFSCESFYNQRDEKFKELDQYLDFIMKSNEPTVLEQGGFEKLKDIANLHFRVRGGPKRPYLEGHELKALSVSRGSLTREEFAEIQSHVTHTYEFLRKIPWGRNFANVPQIAAKHHEKLDGTGYPTQSSADEIPIQTRIMTIADIFDALTASDRPYKKAVPTDRALDILSWEVKSGKCDKEVFDIFVESKVYETVVDHKRKPR